jgi:hypothetical protein
MVLELGDSDLVVSERGLPVRKLEFGPSGPAGAATPPDAAKPGAGPVNGAAASTAPATGASANGAAPNASPTTMAPNGAAPAGATTATSAPAAAAPAASSQGANAVPMLPAHWEGVHLISNYQTRRGGLIRETWDLSKDGKQLTVKTSLPASDDRPGIEFKRVYDRVEADQ